MPKSPIIKARFDDEILKEFNILKARLKLTDAYGADSATLKEAVRLANRHLYLKDNIELFLKQNFPGLK